MTEQKALNISLLYGIILEKLYVLPYAIHRQLPASNYLPKLPQRCMNTLSHCHCGI